MSTTVSLISLERQTSVYYILLCVYIYHFVVIYRYVKTPHASIKSIYTRVNIVRLRFNWTLRALRSYTSCK